MIRNRKRAAWALAAVVLVALLAFAMRPQPLHVDAAAVVRGPLETYVADDGVTRVRDRYVVAAPVAGRMMRVGLRQGDVVQAGDVVAQIAGAPLDVRTEAQAGAHVTAAAAAVREAGTMVTQARAVAAQAQRDADRARTLAEAGALSAAAAEEAALAAAGRRREVEAALARQSAAEAELRAARTAAADADPGRAAEGTLRPVRSPVGGRVLRVAQESETMVAPGTPLVELGDARALEVRVDVLSTDAVRIQPGMPVRVEEWGGVGALTGRVRTVSPSAETRISALGVEEQRVTVVADLDDHPEGLGDGYRVEGRIVTWRAEDVLKVPVSALFRTGEGWNVFVLDGGRARTRTVDVGHRGETEAEVRGGLAEGDTVVLYPSDQVTEGARVRAR